MDIFEALREVSSPVELGTKVGILPGYLIQSPGYLDDLIREEIFRLFYPVARRAFGQKDTEEFRLDVEKHLFNVEGLILVLDEKNRQTHATHPEQGLGLAFRTFSRLRKDVIYLEGVAIDPSCQKIGLYRPLIQVVAQNFPITVTRTQSAVVITTLENIFGSVAPVTRNADEEEKEIARMLADKLGMLGQFDKERLIGKGVYGASLYATPPRGNPRIAKLLYGLIDVWKGDCVIAVCRRQ